MPRSRGPSAEVYPHAPLEFVACEVRYPLAPALVQEAMLPKLQRAFYESFPLVEPVATVETEIQAFMASGAAGIPQGPAGLGIRFLSRDRHASVSVTRNQIVLETTNYPGFQALRDLLQRTLLALEELGAAIPGISRIGLRYIDEIRVGRKLAKPTDWAAYVDSRLVGPLTLTGGTARPDLYQGLLQFDCGEGRRAVMRFGAMQGQAVGNAPLRRRSPSNSGPYFLIDIDSYWAAGDAVPEFSVNRALETIDQLHSPVRELFEAAITERLRSEVLRSKKRGN